MLRRFLGTVLLTGLAGGAVLMARPELVATLPGFGPPPPCTAPIPWYLGDVDPQFGFTRAEIRRAAEEAAAVWSRAADRPLFEPDTAGMAIHLVYDERQQASEERRQRRATLDSRERLIESLNLELRRLQREVTDRERRYQDQPDPATRKAYEEAVDRYNRAVQRYNQAVDALNAEIQEARQDTGTSVRAGNLQTRSQTLNGRVIALERELTVAVAGSYEELVLVLAHELGHALGLDHLDDPGALMAVQYRDDDIQLPVALTAADRRALEALCSSER